MKSKRRDGEKEGEGGGVLWPSWQIWVRLLTCLPMGWVTSQSLDPCSSGYPTSCRRDIELWPTVYVQAIHCTHYKHPDIHVLDRWMPATEAHLVHIKPKLQMRLPVWWQTVTHPHISLMQIPPEFYMGKGKRRMETKKVCIKLITSQTLRHNNGPHTHRHEGV